jgi:hypothetical protein
MHHKKRTVVHAHDRRQGICGRTHVRTHVREFDTKGQVLRKHRARSKRARAADEAIRAEGTKPISNTKNLGRWQKHPETTDIASVDS